VTLPTVIMTSLIRGAKEGDRHGGIYVIDLDSGSWDLAVDWVACDIDWEGRGGARGLRGVAMRDGLIYFAASNEIFAYDTDFKLVDSWHNPCLRHCHEIHLYDHLLYITSTHYDSILVLDIDTGEFIDAYCVRDKFYRYDPLGDKGPEPKDHTHLNSVYRAGSRVYFGCNFRDTLWYIEDGKRRAAGTITHDTHNARPFRGGAIYNHTGGDCVAWSDLKGNIIDSWPVTLYPKSKIIPHPHARQGWARGLCVHEDIIITGHSPVTVMAYDLNKKELIKTINISMDVRNAPHGLCIYEKEAGGQKWQ